MGYDDDEAIDRLGTGNKVYYGRPNPIMEYCFDIAICPDLILAGIALAGAIAFAYLFTVITKKGAGRKKRGAHLPDTITPRQRIKNVMWAGRAISTDKA